MQWVVTTGRTVEEARERALDALGIDEADLELEVLDEPRSSLFGLRRTDARIRARVRPTRPRPKLDRRNRRKTAASAGGRRRRAKRSGGDGPDGSSARADTDAAPPEAAEDDAVDTADAAGGGRGGRRRSRRRSTPGPAPDETVDSGPALDAPTPPEPAPQAPPDTDETPPGTTGDTMTDISLDEQEPSALAFVQGLVDAFGVDATVESHAIDEEHLEISVDGSDLGLLVGPRGSTLNAIQELTRTAVAQQNSGRLQGRLRVDVAGYRARRKEALERFAAQQAERVKESGSPVALEPMSPPDRKIVHDAINDIEGVRTTSEGEDRRRHVVIHPE